MRQFLAIPLPEPLRRVATERRAALALPDRSWRLVREEGLHLTIRFLGEVEPEQQERLDAAWRTAARGTGELRLRVTGASVAAVRSQPRLVWLTVRDESAGGSLARLAARVEAAAREHGFAPASRPFAGHVTLARARRGVRGAVPDVAAVGDLGPFVADRLVLYRSQLGAGGSRYEELSSYPLASEGRA